jgi:hypothetical protein
MEKAILRNKAAVMSALAAAGITSVTVAFDGYGDDGQIDSIVAQSGEVTVQLPASFVAIVDSGDEGTISSDEEACANPFVPHVKWCKSFRDYLRG